MLKKHLQKVWRLIGYAVFTIFAFLISLFFVFPYHTLSDYLTAKAKQSHIHLSIDSLKPSFSGIKATGIKISPISPKLEKINPVSLLPEVDIGEFRIDSLSLRPNPLLFKLTAHLKIANGTIQLSTGIFNQKELTAEAKRVDLSQINFPVLLWIASPETYNGGAITPKLDMEGVLTHAQISFYIPQAQSASEANGNWNIEMDDLTIKQGTLAMPWPDAKELTPVDLPRVVLGNFKSSASIKKGQVQIVQTKTQSDELNFELLGNIQLAKRLAYSEANLTLRLQVQSELLGRLGMFGSAVSLLPVDPQDEQWRKAQLSGQLSRLKMK